MMYPTHRLVNGSSAFVATTAVGLPVYVVAVSVAGAVATTVAPDKIEKMLGVPHRRWHLPSLYLVVFAGLYALAMHYVVDQNGVIGVLCASAAFGCVMHMVADAMTVERHGIKLLWPISRRGYHLLPWSCRVWVGSKSRSERLFVVIWCGFVLIYAYARFRYLIPA
jgi:membrane-bound metal-dependent hydrolase YbcI (DUF457 family)